MTDVEIAYCVPCGHLERAQRVQADLLSELGREVDRVALRTGEGGVFTVSVDGDVVYDKSTGDALDVETIVDEVRARNGG